MATFTKYVPKSEKELHFIIRDELDALEEGLRLVKQEYPTGKGLMDLLCVDSGGRPVIIEVKLHQDENVLFQALRYYSDVESDRYLIATSFPASNIDPDQTPRLVLIAERFSDDIRRLSTLVVPEVELYEYTVLLGPHEAKGICYHPVSLPIAGRPSPEPKTIADLIAYLKNDDLLPVLTRARDRIKSIDDSVREYATQGYIGYRHPSGRQFAFIRIYRRQIGVGAHIIAEDGGLLDYEEARISTPDDSYEETVEQIVSSFQNLESA